MDELNVRESGSSSATVIGQLRGGARVFIIGAPVAEGEMNWYRVAVVSGDLAGYEPCTWWGCMTGIGFVATPISADPFLEAEGEVRKAISVVKKRTGAHENSIRELKLGPDRIQVGEPLRHFQGILTGVPQYIGTSKPLLPNDQSRLR